SPGAAASGAGRSPEAPPGTSRLPPAPRRSKTAGTSAAPPRRTAPRSPTPQPTREAPPLSPGPRSPRQGRRPGKARPGTGVRGSCIRGPCQPPRRARRASSAQSRPAAPPLASPPPQARVLEPLPARAAHPAGTAGPDGPGGAKPPAGALEGQELLNTLAAQLTSRQPARLQPAAQAPHLTRLVDPPHRHLA